MACMGFSCCLHCEKRTLYCHAICREYLTEKETHEKRSASIRAEKEKFNLIPAYNALQAIKYKK